MTPSAPGRRARDGRLLDEGRLPAPLWRLSLRHLAVGRGDALTARMRAYCGGAAVDASGTRLGVSCPRGGLAVFFDLETWAGRRAVCRPPGGSGHAASI